MKKNLSGRLAPMGLIIIMNLLVVHNASGQIAIRGGAANFTTGQSTSASLTINKPTGVVIGDVMIVNIVSFGTTSASAPSLSGWTTIAGTNLNGGTRYGALLYRKVDGTEGSNFVFSTPVNGTTIAVSGAIVAFSGVDVSGANPFDVAPGTLSSAATDPLPVTAITTATSNAAVVMFGMNTSSPAVNYAGWSTTTPGTLTQIYSFTGSTFSTVGAAWAIKSSTGTTGAGSINLSGVPSGANGGILIALRRKCAAAPTVTSPVNLCLNGPSNPLTATGSSLLWYTQAVGGTSSSTAPTPSTSALGSTSYFVSQTVGCESARSQIVVTVNGLPKTTINLQTDITNINCNGGSDGKIKVTASLGTAPYKYGYSTDGINYTWITPSPASTNPYTITGLSPNQPYHIKVQDSNGCISR